MHARLVRWEELRAGEQSGPIRYTVTSAAVDDFCAAAGIPVARYHGLANGADAVPPTLTATDYTALLRGRLRPFVGMHARHSLHLQRPLPVGAPASVAGQIVETYRRRGHSYLVLDYAVEDGDGLRYSSSRITMTVDGYIDVELGEDTGESNETHAQPRQPAARPAGGAAEEQSSASVPAAVGSAAELAFTQERMDRFARQPSLRFPFMAGTPRNHHTDPATARRMGLPGTVAQSLQYCAVAADLVLDRLGPPFLSGGLLEFVFLRPVYAGDLIGIALGSEAALPEQYVLRCTNQRGELVALGTARLEGSNT